MSENTSPLTRLGFIGRKTVQVVHRLLTWKSRRMIFLSSIYGLVMDIKDPDHVNTSQLSQALNIARNPDAIQFPMAIKSVIWYKRIPSGLMVEGRQYQVSDIVRADLTEHVHEALVTEFLEKTPEWLRYAKTSQMRYDLECLFKLLQTSKIS